ncbi:MAG: SusC/RagA family TonB-linked outer membrane protein [Cytophagales bacterium]|nr:SusC/RagA family TonB-linked outer membrane protein [Cytophagales bacterium]
MVKGVITDADTNEPLIGANVSVKGTVNGVITDFDGKYSIKVQEENAVLVISYIGYLSTEMEVAGRSEINAQLQVSVAQLNDVVVTAFGIKKEKKALGYAVTDVDGDELATVKSNSLVNSISGRVPGVNITAPSTFGGASSVVIRGNASISGNNQPLYVVDGVPIDNSNHSAVGMWGGYDLGDGISSINPDDIESMTTLKGAAATALYGSRAQNGAIIITTKSGKFNEGLGIEINSNVTLQQIYDVYDEFQNEYGQGTKGKSPVNLEQVLETGNKSWGPRINGENVLFFDGKKHASSVNDLNEFFDLGKIFTNTVALTKGSEDMNIRVSATNMNNQSVIPNASMNRNSFNARLHANLSERLSVDAKANYISEKYKNRARAGSAPSNPMNALMKAPRNLPLSLLENNYKSTLGGHIPWGNDIWSPNPYWVQNEFSQKDQKDRFLGFVSAAYKFTDWLSLDVKAGTDYYQTTDFFSFGHGTSFKQVGEMGRDQFKNREDNYSAMLRFDKDITDDIHLNAMLGTNIMRTKLEVMDTWGENMTQKDKFVLNNFRKTRVEERFSKKGLNSYFGSVEASFRNYLFFTATLRNDVSSTLKKSNRSYWYPSFSGSFVFSEVFETLPDWLSIGKLRASWAKVGGDTDPYQTDLYYDIVGQGYQNKFGGHAHVVGLNGTMPSLDLKPSETKSYEFGGVLGFLDNRINLDITYYNQRTVNQIMDVQITPTSGYNKMKVNAGEVENSGIEVMLETKPIAVKDFSWDLSLNFSKNKNEVISLVDGVNSLRLAEARGDIRIEAQPGRPYGEIIGKTIKRNEAGQLILDDKNLPKEGDHKTLGNILPDWTGGVFNSFRYKNFSLNALIDIKSGGDIVSMTNQAAYANGNHKETLAGREGGVKVTGVDKNGKPVSATVEAEDYYRVMARDVSNFVYDASFIRLKELSITYNLPKSIIEKTPIQSASFSVVGGNLFYLYEDVPNVNPEGGENSTDRIGIEYGSMPSIRTYGFNLKVTL